uniref:EF-hand domain-containing protein n=1 Tax=Macaca fascicularis TaxID=9541 RepID=Q95LY8_MACFA|nr:hypothetical protein [Macaca fascicularis]
MDNRNTQMYTEEKTASSFLPSMPGPTKTKGGGEAVETQPAPGPLPPPEVRDIGERREPDRVQQQPQKPVVAAGTQNLRKFRQGFMKCLLEVEKVEASHRRALKARSLTAQKSPRTLTPVPTSSPSLPQTPASAPASGPSWARLSAPGPEPAPVGAPVPTSTPCPVLLCPALDLGWRRMELSHHSSERTLSYAKARQEPEEQSLQKLYQNREKSEEQLTLKQEEAFRSYFEIFNGPGEVDAQSLKNILLLMGFSVTPAQVEDALMSADVNGDGHVDFKDFLAVMTDTRRFFCSVEQNALTDMAPHNPHTLLFEILSLLVEMLALPEAVLEEITNYYQKKLKAGTCKAQEMEAAIGRLRLQKQLPYNPQQEESSEVPERKVLSILSRLKQQNYAPNLQSPYAQVPCIPLCPRMDKKMVRRKQLSSASGGPEKGPRYRDTFKEGPSELRTQEQRPPAKPGKKQSSWVPQEGSQELQAGQDQSELGLLPSWVPEGPEGLQQLGSGKEIEGQQRRQRNRGTGEDEPPESCQGPGYQSTLGHQADVVQPAEPCCPLAGRGQPLGDKRPKEADVPHIRPQEAPPEPSPGAHGDSSQEAMPPTSTVAPEETGNTTLTAESGPALCLLEPTDPLEA